MGNLGLRKAYVIVFVLEFIAPHSQHLIYPAPHRPGIIPCHLLYLQKQPASFSAFFLRCPFFRL
jgi:hypothetical protein